MQADLVQPYDPRASVQTQPAYYDYADPEAMDTDDAPAPRSRGLRSDEVPFNAPTGPRNPSNPRRQEPRRSSGGGGRQRQQQAAPARSLLARISGPAR